MMVLLPLFDTACIELLIRILAALCDCIKYLNPKSVGYSVAISERSPKPPNILKYKAPLLL